MKCFPVCWWDWKKCSENISMPNKKATWLNVLIMIDVFQFGESDRSPEVFRSSGRWRLRPDAVLHHRRRQPLPADVHHRRGKRNWNWYFIFLLLLLFCFCCCCCYFVAAVVSVVVAAVIVIVIVIVVVAAYVVVVIY